MGRPTIFRSRFLTALILLLSAWSPITLASTDLDPAIDELTQEVIQSISRQLGVEPGSINTDTDLVTDLGADPMTAFEFLVLLCDEYQIELPANSNMTRVGDIVSYVREAPPKDTPVVFRGGRSNSVSKKKLLVQRVFFGTDRNLLQQRGNDDDTANFFGPSRSANGTIHYGTCEVTIPVSVHRRGQIERPQWWRFELREDPERHIVLRSIDPLSRTDFLALIDTTLSDSTHNPGKDVLVFVHGFNVSFAAAARRTAQMAYDLEFNGLPVFFSWPSDARLTAYMADREDVEWAVLHFEQFLLDLKKNSSAERIHLVAHSMGNQALIRTLLMLTLRNQPTEPLFENVIMAAPDFDAERFVDQIAPQIAPMAKRWTLYASEKDFALDVSTTLAAKRLGLPLAVAQGVDTVDASGIDVVPWSVPETHGYFASKQRVIRDMRQVLLGVNPLERGLIGKAQKGRSYWELQPIAQ